MLSAFSVEGQKKIHGKPMNDQSKTHNCSEILIDDGLSIAVWCALSVHIALKCMHNFQSVIP